MEENNIEEEMTDWDKYQIHVLSEIKRLADNIEKVCEKCEDLSIKYYAINQDLAVIKTKARNIGTTFGVLGSLLYPVLERVIELIQIKR